MSLHHHDHAPARDGHAPDSLHVLAIDVGAGTQDVLVWEGDREPENCPKLVVPSQTQVVGAKVRAATAARTLHNDHGRVEQMGVVVCDDAPAGAVVVETKDIDLAALAAALAALGVELPRTVALAVQDHGYRPGASNNEVRFEYLQGLLAGGGELARMVYQEPPVGMTRMRAVRETVPGAYVMDTGAAAVLGALGDPAVARAAAGEGAILVNVGNMHTFATLVQGRRLFG